MFSSLGLSLSLISPLITEIFFKPFMFSIELFSQIAKYSKSLRTFSNPFIFNRLEFPTIPRY